ncbi:MAG: TetR/AcrR family transcriptional regulator [Candidatus Lernaella stagnicola]|nr:TetR/AcrR family transcriptional regulator [Candidatus Lernaella stagnicola]
MDEAIRLFGSNGFEGTSLQAIAESVGIRKQSLLYHFNSKKTLREAVNDDLMQHWSRELPRLLSDTASGHDRFADMITALVDFFLDDENRARHVVREMLDRPEGAPELVRQHLRPWLDLITNYIRLGQRSDVIKSDVDPESYVFQVMMMVIGTVAMGRTADDFFPQKKRTNLAPRIAELVRVARESLFVDPSSPSLSAKRRSDG